MVQVRVGSERSEAPADVRAGWLAVVRTTAADVAWLVGVTLVAVLLATAAQLLAGPPDDRIPTIPASAFVISASLALVAYVGFRERRKLRGWLRFSPGSVVLGLVGGVGLFLIGAIYGLLLELVGIPIPDVAADLKDAFPWIWMLVVLAVVLAPLGEELYFRGRFYDLVLNHAGHTAAVLLTSTAFGLVHFMPLLFPAYVAFGMVLVALRRLSGGLVAPMLAHAVNNSVAVLGVWLLDP